MPTTRDEYLALCRLQAHAELRVGEVMEAYELLVKTISLEPDIAEEFALLFLHGKNLLASGQLGRPGALRDWIDSFV